MQDANAEFLKFNKNYKKQLDKIMKKNPDMDLFDQVDLALKETKAEERHDLQRHI